MEDQKNIIKVTIIENGPVLMNGNIELTNSDGSMETKQKVALCRCGASSNKPYCDGTHKKIEFQG